MHPLVGTRFGPYEIVSPLGAGGMGEVYRARDTQLNRDVAIKILPELFARDAERLARFTREAQTLAALNHPNIAHIHGLEGDGSPARPRALVLELVEGDDLSAVIARGPLSLADLLPIARQIADALEAAHEAGIIHRDLKPANIKVRSDGTVKVLDFGLAKAIAPDGAIATVDAMQSPTLTAHGTQMGVILGTAAYMAPEQAKGKAVDKRADIWAFGVILYEMLTGRRAYEGDDLSDVLASVLKSAPDWTSLPPDTPTSVRRLLRRCLEKDPRKRLSAIGDARLELDENDGAAVVPAAAGPATHRTVPGWVWPAIATVAVVVAIVALSGPARTKSDAAARVSRLSLLPPPGVNIFPDSVNVAISPNGTMVAFVVGGVLRSETELWVRSLDSMAARRLEGGDGANLPFWSPDSRRIGFFTPTKLKTIAASGGRAEVLADTPGARGGTWSRSNVIVYAPDASGPLYRIPATGGTPVPVTALDPARKESGHRFPTFLPDGRRFLFASLPGKLGKFDIFAGSLENNDRTHIAVLDSMPVFAEPGWLLYARQGVLAAQPFDPRTAKMIGEPVPLADEPASILDPINSFTAGVCVSVSATGALAYFSAASTKTSVAWHTLDGRRGTELDLPPAHYGSATISPDGTRAIVVKSISPSESSLWLVDLVRGGALPFSSGPGRNDAPVWSPDGTRVVFAADRAGAQDLFVRRVGDAEPEQPLYRSEALFKAPESWTPDGQSILFAQLDPDGTFNQWLIPASGTGSARVFVRGPNRDILSAPSPDGRWLAYLSDETGRLELYLRSFATGIDRQQISRQGASKAWWTRDARQLMFLTGDLRSLWAVDVTAGAPLTVGTPRQIGTFPPGVIPTDPAPDRQRFLAVVPDRTGPGSVTIVQNWQAALGK